MVADKNEILTVKFTAVNFTYNRTRSERSGGHGHNKKKHSALLQTLSIPVHKMAGAH
jgi:hypothetical protein